MKVAIPMNKDLVKALVEQFNLEYESSYLYLSMAAHFDTEGFNGLSAWMKKQSQEELVHAMKFWSFIFEANETVVLAGLKAPQTGWKSVTDVFQASLAHEQKITASINAIIDLAIQHKAHAAHHFLLGFATEQVEEENTVRDILRKLEIVANNHVGLLMLDKELGARVG